MKIGLSINLKIKWKLKKYITDYQSLSITIT